MSIVLPTRDTRHFQYIIQNNRKNLQIFTLGSLGETAHRLNVRWTTALTVALVATTRWRSLAGEYFTRVVKVTDRTEFRSVQGFEFHRTVRQRKIMHRKARTYNESIDSISTLDHFGELTIE